MGSGAFLVEACRQLGDELVRAWHAHECVPAIPPDEDEVLHARRLVAQRCLYGVDKNRMAVDLSKLSLWLSTLAKDHPFTFLDHALRCGDSLVGLAKQQISGFHRQPKQQRSLIQDRIDREMQAVARSRKEILDAHEDVPYPDQESRLARADENLQLSRFVGNLVVSAFFHGAKKKAREERCDDLFLKLSAWLSAGLRPDFRTRLAEAAAELQTGNHPVEPFHWEIEFPEVFDRENAGFDAIVGNPPFAQKNTLVQSLGEQYSAYLLQLHSGTNGKSDLCGFFFRQAFEL
jgi:hypothetical protein